MLYNFVLKISVVNIIILIWEICLIHESSYFIIPIQLQTLQNIISQYFWKQIKLSQYHFTWQNCISNFMHKKFFRLNSFKVCIMFSCFFIHKSTSIISDDINRFLSIDRFFFLEMYQRSISGHINSIYYLKIKQNTLFYYFKFILHYMESVLYCVSLESAIFFYDF